MQNVSSSKMEYGCYVEFSASLYVVFQDITKIVRTEQQISV